MNQPKIGQDQPAAQPVPATPPPAPKPETINQFDQAANQPQPTLMASNSLPDGPDNANSNNASSDPQPSQNEPGNDGAVTRANNSDDDGGGGGGSELLKRGLGVVAGLITSLTPANPDIPKIPNLPKGPIGETTEQVGTRKKREEETENEQRDKGQAGAGPDPEPSDGPSFSPSQADQDSGINWWAVGGAVALTGVAVGAALIPFDGPAGEIAAGAGAAKLWQVGLGVALL